MLEKEKKKYKEKEVERNQGMEEDFANRKEEGDRRGGRGRGQS